ncbi:hypothetical protein Nepgr_013497 [Nepenthes gracilis]|uniref:Uncharacterized protein n=1 Tax=Nepenthes gracilis TaxID=150966 RepID=A0AAD3XPE5_NEPGR|nr:hypothetical protein Nepgr_013497 [Nepenthes gracilis]
MGRQIEKFNEISKNHPARKQHQIWRIERRRGHPIPPVRIKPRSNIQRLPDLQRSPAAKRHKSGHLFEGQEDPTAFETSNKKDSSIPIITRPIGSKAINHPHQNFTRPTTRAEFISSGGKALMKRHRDCNYRSAIPNCSRFIICSLG